MLWAAVSAFAQLDGVIDLHVHSAPDSGPRSIDALEVARMARRRNMRALLFKNHYTSTAPLAYLVSQAVPGIEAYGGIVLNRSVGGINPAAVEHMAKTTGGRGRVVWMPTFDSGHYHRTVKPNPAFVPVSRGGELLPEVDSVLSLMAAFDLALATGHSSPRESLLLIRAARQAGIERIIVTHPLLPDVGMSLELQRQAARLGAFLEYPIALMLPPASISVEEFAEAVRSVGPPHVILTSDLGQVLNPVHTDGLTAFLARLRERGFTRQQINLMTKSNPARFLGLD
ncbi:MAG: DUF6282 family protein [Bryobacterales bacterium]|nr:DUF6282 family protein [Bryobacterales bacterium]